MAGQTAMVSGRLKTTNGVKNNSLNTTVYPLLITSFNLPFFCHSARFQHALIAFLLLILYHYNNDIRNQGLVIQDDEMNWINRNIVLRSLLHRSSSYCTCGRTRSRLLEIRNSGRELILITILNKSHNNRPLVSLPID